MAFRLRFSELHGSVLPGPHGGAHARGSVPSAKALVSSVIWVRAGFLVGELLQNTGGTQKPPENWKRPGARRLDFQGRCATQWFSTTHADAGETKHGRGEKGCVPPVLFWLVHDQRMPFPTNTRTQGSHRATWRRKGHACLLAA